MTTSGPGRRLAQGEQPRWQLHPQPGTGTALRKQPCFLHLFCEAMQGWHLPCPKGQALLLMKSSSPALIRPRRAHRSAS